MNDSISRKVAIDAMEEKAYITIYEDEISGLVQAKKVLELLPSIDAVEVVRCKDCKHLGIKDLVYGYCKYRMTGIIMPDDFCSYGERKKP